MQPPALILLVLLDDDLVDSSKPGDRVQIVGVYRALAPSAASGKTSFRTVIIANSIMSLDKEARECIVIFQFKILLFKALFSSNFDERGCCQHCQNFKSR